MEVRCKKSESNAVVDQHSQDRLGLQDTATMEKRRALVFCLLPREESALRGRNALSLSMLQNKFLCGKNFAIEPWLKLMLPRVIHTGGDLSE